jgi:hypothetical protein
VRFVVRSFSAAGAALFLAGSAADAVTFNASFAPIKIAAKPGQVLTTNYRLALDDGDPRTHFKVESAGLVAKRGRAAVLLRAGRVDLALVRTLGVRQSHGSHRERGQAAADPPHGFDSTGCSTWRVLVCAQRRRDA